MQCIVDLFSNFGRVVKFCDVVGDFGVYVGKDVEVVIFKCMVQKYVIVLGEGGWIVDNVNDWDVFGESIGDIIDG